MCCYIYLLYKIDIYLTESRVFISLCTPLEQIEVFGTTHDENYHFKDNVSITQNHRKEKQS